NTSTWNFTTQWRSFTDTTVADFGTGTGTSTYVAQDANGELTLAPTAGAEFAGTALPADWSSTTWTTGGTATVSGGLLRVDGARAGSNTMFGPGSSLDFIATLSGAAFQNVGLGTDFNSTPWAMFSTGSTGGVLYARTNTGVSSNDTLLAGNYFGAPH